MITLELAMSLPRGTVLWHMHLTNADGTPRRSRVNGKCKTWKTRPGDFRLPMTYDLKHHFDIFRCDATEPKFSNCGNWCTPERWPAEHVLYEGV